MKKLQKTINEINKAIAEVQEYLSTQSMNISVIDNDIILGDEDADIVITIPTNCEENVLSNTDVKSVLLYCINYLYNNNIKQCKRYISTSKTIYKNKIGKLSKLMSNNDGKIEADMFNKTFAEYNKLVADMVLRHDESKKYEDILQFCNDVVQTYYEVLNVLYKDWKQEDIAEYMVEKGYNCVLLNNKTLLRIIFCEADTVKKKATMDIKVDNYSRKANVLNVIKMQEQILKDEGTL